MSRRSVLARLAVAVGQDFAEQLIGQLLTETFRGRMAGSSLEDVHEARHLAAALAAGNSDPCDGGRDCHLDRETMRRLHDANWPHSDPMATFMDVR